MYMYWAIVEQQVYCLLVGPLSNIVVALAVLQSNDVAALRPGSVGIIGATAGSERRRRTEAWVIVDVDSSPRDYISCFGAYFAQV